MQVLGIPMQVFDYRATVIFEEVLGHCPGPLVLLREQSSVTTVGVSGQVGELWSLNSGPVVFIKTQSSGLAVSDLSVRLQGTDCTPVILQQDHQ